MTLLGDELDDLRGRRIAGSVTLVLAAASAAGLAAVVEPAWVAAVPTVVVLAVGAWLGRRGRRRERSIQRLLDRLPDTLAG